MRALPVRAKSKLSAVLWPFLAGGKSSNNSNQSASRHQRGHVTFADTGPAQRVASEGNLEDWQPVQARIAMQEAIKIYSATDAVRLCYPVKDRPLMRASGAC
jgi:hypothetical protein